MIMKNGSEATRERAKRREERVKQTLLAPPDALLALLRGHLYLESLLEQIIAVRLPRGDKILQNGNLSFYQKLTLVESLNVLPHLDLDR
jgi:hypothetical protein